MQIEVFGSQQLLDQLRLHIQDQLEKRGYTEGPKISSMEMGVLIDYMKNGVIISIQVSQESETGDSVLRVESEQEVPELREAWDDALISYGREILEKLRSFAVDQAKVDQGLR